MIKRFFLTTLVLCCCLVSTTAWANDNSNIWRADPNKDINSIENFTEIFNPTTEKNPISYSAADKARASEIVAGIKDPNGILEVFREMSDRITPKIAAHARTLFYWLSLLSLGIMLARILLGGEATLTNILGAFAKWLIYTGVFYWIINGIADMGATWNSPTSGDSITLVSWPKLIFNSFDSIGVDVTGTNLNPGAVLMRGVETFGELMKAGAKVSLLHVPAAGIVGICILVCFCILAATFAVTMIEAYLVICGGSIFLGFAGLEYTRDLAFNYLKYSIAVGIKLLVIMMITAMAMVFGNNAILAMRALGPASNQFWSTTGFLLGIAVIMVLAAQMVPSVAQGIITGSSINGGGMGALRAAAMAPVAAAGAAIGGLAAAKGMASAPFRTASDLAQVAQVARQRAAERSSNSASKPGAKVEPPSQWAGMKGVAGYLAKSAVFGNQHWRTTRDLGDRTGVYVDPPEN